MTRPTATLLNIQGSQDAIRFGDLVFTGQGHPRRRFQLDLLTGQYRLFAFDPHGSCERREDRDPGRRRAAGAVLGAEAGGWKVVRG